MKVFHISLVLFGVGCCVVSKDVTSYPRCTDLSNENPGYSSYLRGGLKFWTHCAFPNPKMEASRCGRKYINNRFYSVCDPDNLFIDYTRVQLDVATWSVEQGTPYKCTPWHGHVLNYTMVIVAVRYIRIPDLSTNQTCINNCGELIPDFDATTRTPTTEEKQSAIESFAEGLLLTYDSYFCDNFGVIVYWESESMISTALSKGLKSVISAENVAIAEALALPNIMNGTIVAGMKMMLEHYQNVLLGLTPAFILLIANLVILLVVTVAIMAYFIVGSKSDYYDEETWKLFITYTMQLIFGVACIEAMMASLVWIQNRMRPVMVLIPLLGFFACIGVAAYLFIQESTNS